jgi:hypothetical protein
MKTTTATTTVTQIVTPEVTIEVFIMVVDGEMLSNIETKPTWGPNGDPDVCDGCCRLHHSCRC